MAPMTSGVHTILSRCVVRRHRMTDPDTYCTTLATLLAEARTLSAPYDAQIRALEIAKADTISALTWEIENLKAVIRPLVLGEQRTVKAKGLAVAYCHKEIWDDASLRLFAEEVPAVLQCRKDASYVVFR